MSIPGGLLPLGGLPFSHGPQGEYRHHGHPSRGEDRSDEANRAGEGRTVVGALEIGDRVPDQAAGRPGHKDGEEGQGSGHR